MLPAFRVLHDLFMAAENEVRCYEPRFRGGFVAIRLQGDITKITVTQLEHVRARVVAKSNTVSRDLHTLRQHQAAAAQNNYQIQDGIRLGTALVSLRPALKTLLKKQVNKANLSPAQREAPAHRAKVQWQNANHTLRNQKNGLYQILEIIDDCTYRLELRLRCVRTLVRIGDRWQLKELSYEDGIKVGMAEKEMTDCEAERKEVEATIDMLNAWLDEQEIKDAEAEAETEDDDKGDEDDAEDEVAHKV